ncbi:hypothetical protein NC653_033186 [Populus alba x Populus x berolinensis]|uniref:Uncharacterized protein n=1 Tax=Populus alba x Populus x berolinensis TaxID=444605 RepID=A0AAD6LT93_9ROSI|nr:hypothetical protein NC653_033186 [Populus alba x Populus x berolinensis]
MPFLFSKTTKTQRTNTTTHPSHKNLFYQRKTCIWPPFIVICFI